MSRISTTINSFFYTKKSFKYIRVNPWIWKYLIIPFIINLILSISLLFLLFNSIQGMLLGLSFLSVIPGFFTGFISILVFIITFIITVYLFFLLANIIAAPFNGLFTDKMLSDAGIVSENKTNLANLFIREISRAIKFEILKLFLVIVLFFTGLVISLIPAIGFLMAGLLSFVGNTYLSLVDYFDPGLSYIGVNISGRFKYVKNIVKDSWGFFIISGFVMYIPILNILYIPFAVITANLLLIEKNKSK